MMLRTPRHARWGAASAVALACSLQASGCGGDDVSAVTDTDASSTGGATTLTTTTMTSTTGSTTQGTETVDPDSGTTTGDTEGTDTGGTATGSTGDDSTGSSSTGGFVLPDFSGEFLLIASSVAEPDLPLQYIATIDVILDDDGGGTMDVELQALTLDVGSTTTPRLSFGDPVDYLGVEVAADGSFSFVVGAISIPGPTNPINGIDVEFDNVVLQGQVLDEDASCGAIEGDVTSPVQSDLAGSTFAAVRVADTADLPETFPLGCPR
jgi:hypothetical protein